LIIQIINREKSYYNKEKAEKTLEMIASKNKSHESGDNQSSPKLYRHDRYYHTEEIIKNEKKKTEIYNFREETINKTKEKVEAFNQKKDQIETNRLKGKYDFSKHDYGKFGNLDKSDRITIFHDAAYQGEHVPFCSQITPDPKTLEVSDSTGKKRSVENFERFNYPKNKLILSQSPKYGFFMKNSVVTNDVKDKIAEESKSRMNEMKERILNKNKGRENLFEGDLRSSYNIVRDYRKKFGPALHNVKYFNIAHCYYFSI
jgi:hypothetical protein